MPKNSDNGNGGTSGSGFLDRLRKVRPFTPDIDVEGEILPAPRKLQDPSVYNPMDTLMNPRTVASLKRGGKVKKTGIAKVHKGERVLTKAQAKKPEVKRAIKAPSQRAAKASSRRAIKTPARPGRPAPRQPARR